MSPKVYSSWRLRKSFSLVMWSEENSHFSSLSVVQGVSWWKLEKSIWQAQLCDRSHFQGSFPLLDSIPWQRVVFQHPVDPSPNARKAKIFVVFRKLKAETSLSEGLSKVNPLGTWWVWAVSHEEKQACVCVWAFAHVQKFLMVAGKGYISSCPFQAHQGQLSWGVPLICVDLRY